MTNLPALCLAALLVACRTVAPGLSEEVTPTPPHIVLLMADDQGWGELSSRGHGDLETPELDRLGADGLTFERFYAAAPVCSPTRASVLTGRHPNRTGVLAWGHELSGAEVTLAELLATQGYRTGHFGKWHLGSVAADAPTSPGAQGFDTWLSSPNFYENDPAFSAAGERVELAGESSVVTALAALDFLAAAPDEPALAVVWFGSPHTPHRATEAEAARLADTPASFRAYRAELEGLDHAVGELRAGLDELGIAGNTIVWYTSDNGPRPPGPAEGEAAVDRRAQATGGLRGSKGTLWEGGIRVPSFVVWPGRIAPGTRTAVPASTVDLMPTLAALTRTLLWLHRDAPYDGRNLSGLLVGDERRPTVPTGLGFWSYPAPGRPTYSDRILDALPEDTTPGMTDEERAARELLRGTPDTWPGDSAWIEADLKLHRRRAKDGTVTFELYDLVRDPGETTDLAPARSELVARMAADLETWRREVVADLLGP